MKRFLLICFCLIALTGLLWAQDVPMFVRTNSESIGLPKVLVDRWGCSAADIDRNGWPDLFNNKWRGRLDSEIYMNYNGVFTDIYGNSPELRAAEWEGNATRTPVLVDFDNDGDRDLMIGFDYSHQMFRNDNNVFVNITQQLGLINKMPGFVTTYGYEQSAWIDWDNDGDLDCLMAQTNNPNFLFYRNDGNTFVDIAAQVGLAGVNELGADGDRGYNTTRVQWIDWDLDGDPDLSAGWKLFRNDGGHLTDVSAAVGFLPFHRIRFLDWFDYDLDGDFDFFLTGYEDRDEVWRNDNGTFVNATQETMLDLFTDNGQSTLNVGDFDNDGDQDCFMSINDHEDIEAMLLNEEEGGVRSFISVAQFAGFADLIGDRKGAAILDYDMDGLLDILSPSLDYGTLVYHNTGLTSPNNWIGFDLWGSKSNKDALGSLVTLYAGGKKQIRYTKAAQCWKMQDNPYVHFGIGKAAAIDSLVIRWPRGDVETFTNLEINRYHKIVELSATAVEAEERQAPTRFNLEQNYPNPFNPSTTIAYELEQAQEVSVAIYNVFGEEIVKLVDQKQALGHHRVVWNGRDRHGRPAPAGLYIYQLRAGQAALSRKMVLVQ
ncbi:MAG TPA: FG-GAP-like repeat-containing protein [bacterium]|nr:FG-GAP-like repeat-containing protein [bacterium]